MLPLLALLAAAPNLTTAAERSGFTETGRFDEVQALCAAFPKAFPGKVKCEPFGTTPLGRPMLVFTASADGTLSGTFTAVWGAPLQAEGPVSAALTAP